MYYIQFVDFDRGIVSISSSRSAEANGKVTKVKCVCAATSTEHNIAPRIVFDSKQVKFQAKDVQLQSEWSEQYVYDMCATRFDRNINLIVA